jgi:hypothetical protein
MTGEHRYCGFQSLEVQMQKEIRHLAQTEDGLRKVMEGDVDGARIKVITGYDIWLDAWPYHVRVERPGESMVQLSAYPTRFKAQSMEAAFEKGMELGIRYLSQPAGETPPEGGQP